MSIGFVKKFVASLEKHYCKTCILNAPVDIMDSMKGMILEGGAMRGMFTCGITDVFMENGIVFDGIIGVSAGATFGCNYKSKQPGRAIRYNTKFSRDSHYGTFRNLMRNGDLYDAKFCYEDIPFKLDLFDVKTYAENPLKFYVVVSDLGTGKPIVHEIPKGDRDDLLWMRASASLPLVSTPVVIEGKRYLDGGITSSIPLKQFMEMGYDRNIVILTRTREYVKKPSSFATLMKFILRKYPNLVKAMINRHIMYDEEKTFVFEQEKLGNCYVIAPEVDVGISRTEHNPNELRRVYEMGRQAGIKHLEAVKEYLK